MRLTEWRRARAGADWLDRARAGLANICVITNHTTIIRQRIEVPVPRKRKGGATALGADKAHNKFYDQVYAAVERHFDLDTLKVLIIASPGFVKESVHQHILDEAVVRIQVGNSFLGRG